MQAAYDCRNSRRYLLIRHLINRLQQTGRGRRVRWCSLGTATTVTEVLKRTERKPRSFSGHIYIYTAKVFIKCKILSVAAILSAYRYHIDSNRIESKQNYWHGHWVLFVWCCCCLLLLFLHLISDLPLWKKSTLKTDVWQPPKYDGNAAILCQASVQVTSWKRPSCRVEKIDQYVTGQPFPALYR